jgi:hypothetical protein
VVEADRGVAGLALRAPQPATYSAVITRESG